ncbi:helix-turn-helix domain-containing protein [Candidatus Margulisiibacteriota bacterium]
MSSDNEALKYSNIDLGKHITKLRKTIGYSMYRLSLESGISNSVLMRIEKGEREPKINTLLKVIAGLNITPSKFFEKFN